MVYDCITFFNELDLLEIRLNILDPYVDYFVIGEGEETFSGIPKPFNFELNQERFAKWSHKIKYLKIGKHETDSAFERARYQKESIKSLLTLLNPKDDDIVYFGDLDEIWKPQEIKDDKVYNLEQLNYCYYLNQRSSERWVGTIVGKWKTIKENTFSHWRATHTNELPNGGYHFTNVGGADQIRLKLNAYDHQEFNNEQIRADIDRKIANGEDYVGRRTDWEGKPFEMWISELDLPKYILDNKTTWIKLFQS